MLNWRTFSKYLTNQEYIQATSVELKQEKSELMWSKITLEPKLYAACKL